MLNRRLFLAGVGLLASGAAAGASGDVLDAARRLAGRPFGADWRDLLPGLDGLAAAAGRIVSGPFTVAPMAAAPLFADETTTVVAFPGSSGSRVPGGAFALTIAAADGGIGTELGFLGATVFELAGPGQRAGALARLLAVRVADPRGEEFPQARAILVTAGADGVLRLDALVDGPSATAAARIEADPASPGRVEVDVTVFPRAAMPSAGIAPLTATYLHAPGDGMPVDDVRPALHDAEGLWMRNGADERIWRPLSNPAALQLSAFADRAPKAYALVQRSRDPARFLDPATSPQLRPTLMVEPLDDWGEGFVTLFEIPSRSEESDNTGVFWQPAAPLAASGDARFRYRLSAVDDVPAMPGAARIRAVRSGAVAGDGAEEARRYAVLYDLPPGADPSRARSAVRAEPARAVDLSLADLGGGRVASLFTLRRPPGLAVDFRADLWFDGGMPADVLLHRWP